MKMYLLKTEHTKQQQKKHYPLNESVQELSADIVFKSGDNVTEKV